jgi:hypothetical protein
VYKFHAAAQPGTQVRVGGGDDTIGRNAPIAEFPAPG